MGASLVLVAVDRAAEAKVGHAAARLLTRMAVSALDDADRPWSQLPLGDLIRAMGAEPDEAGKRVVMRARRELVAAGIIAADGGGHRGGAARYDLLFTADGTVLEPLERGTVSVPQSTEKGGRIRSERGTNSVGKGDENGPRGRVAPLKEELEEKEEGAPPVCRRHPHGWDHDEPCQPCKAARLAAEARRPVEPPTMSGIITVQPGRLHHCAPGTHRLVADRASCMVCDWRSSDDIPIAQNEFFRPTALAELEARF